MKILITGASGYLGKYIIRDLIPKVDTLYLLVQKENLEDLIKTFGHHKNIKIIPGDIKNPLVFDNENDFKKVRKNADIILHAAGCNDEGTDLSTCYLKNVRGTQNVLQMAKAFSNLSVFHYISTLAVNGDYKGNLKPDSLDKGQSFSSAFAKSKFETERLFRDYDLGPVKKRIYRLGHLVGESFSGGMPEKRGPYSFFENLIKLRPKKFLLSTLKYLPMPLDKESIIPLIPVNHASRFVAVQILLNKGRSRLKCFHVYSEKCPTIKDFIQDAFDKFGFSINIVPVANEKINLGMLEKIGLPMGFLNNLFPIKAGAEKNTFSFPGGRRSMYNSYKWELIESVKNKKHRPRGIFND